VDDIARLPARLRNAMGPHVVGILRHHLSAVLDAVWNDRLKQWNASGRHPYQVDEAIYDRFMSYIAPPTAGFNVIVHRL
jgi:hypothetical protein